MKNILKSIGWLILNVALQFIVQLAFSISAVASGITDDALLNQWLNERLLAVTVISNALFVVAAILICKLRRVKLKEEWQLCSPSAKSYIMPCIIALTYSMAFALFTYNAQTNAASPTHISAEHYGAFGIPMLVLALLISAPITEELLCRGIMMNTLKKSFSAKAAILISSAIFGIMHIMAGGVVLAIGAFLMGFVLAVIYEKTNSLFIAVAAHIIANIPDFILYTSPQMNDVLRIALAVILLAVSVVCLILWCKPKKGETI